jgi:hypothetical protein
MQHDGRQRITEFMGHPRRQATQQGKVGGLLRLAFQARALHQCVA